MELENLFHVFIRIKVVDSIIGAFMVVIVAAAIFAVVTVIIINSLLIESFSLGHKIELTHLIERFTQ